ncbi:hypothetical protein EVAR_99070_1 [Eumeta japonica]|uniref:Uncharacterized protein n=1 Tax=Eumeta variegata TaxID=151549 RepID=A0A4C1TB91_EUMVA|nr:hypothetical protein EVAR_99070_1 [Eumeta japonica]
MGISGSTSYQPENEKLITELLPATPPTWVESRAKAINIANPRRQGLRNHSPQNCNRIIQTDRRLVGQPFTDTPRRLFVNPLQKFPFLVIVKHQDARSRHRDLLLDAAHLAVAGRSIHLMLQVETAFKAAAQFAQQTFCRCDSLRIIFNVSGARAPDPSLPDACAAAVAATSAGIHTADTHSKVTVCLRLADRKRNSLTTPRLGAAPEALGVCGRRVVLQVSSESWPLRSRCEWLFFLFGYSAEPEMRQGGRGGRGVRSLIYVLIRDRKIRYRQGHNRRVSQDGPRRTPRAAVGGSRVSRLERSERSILTWSIGCFRFDYLNLIKIHVLPPPTRGWRTLLSQAYVSIAGNPPPVSADAGGGRHEAGRLATRSIALKTNETSPGAAGACGACGAARYINQPAAVVPAGPEVAAPRRRTRPPRPGCELPPRRSVGVGTPERGSRTLTQIHVPEATHTRARAAVCARVSMRGCVQPASACCRPGN